MQHGINPQNVDRNEDASPGKINRPEMPSISLPKGGGSIRGMGEKFASNPVPGTIDVADKTDKNDPTTKKDPLVKDSSRGNLLAGKLSNIVKPEKPDEELKLYFDTNAISDLWIVVLWNE